MKLPCSLISLATLAIGSEQSMAVVVNVMCVFKDVGGDELTAVQGDNTLAFGPICSVASAYRRWI